VRRAVVVALLPPRRLQQTVRLVVGSTEGLAADLRLGLGSRPASVAGDLPADRVARAAAPAVRRDPLPSGGELASRLRVSRRPRGAEDVLRSLAGNVADIPGNGLHCMPRAHRWYERRPSVGTSLAANRWRHHLADPHLPKMVGGRTGVGASEGCAAAVLNLPWEVAAVAGDGAKRTVALAGPPGGPAVRQGPRSGFPLRRRPGGERPGGGHLVDRTEGAADDIGLGGLPADPTPVARDLCAGPC